MHQTLLDRLVSGQPLLGYKEGGNSMVPLIYSKQPVDVWPVDCDKIAPGDIVIARVHGTIYNHLVSAVEQNRVQISNNRGHVNGWTHRKKVYGIVTHIDGVEVPGAREKISAKSISDYQRCYRTT